MISFKLERVGKNYVLHVFLIVSNLGENILKSGISKIIVLIVVSIIFKPNKYYTYDIHGIF